MAYSDYELSFLVRNSSKANSAAVDAELEVKKTSSIGRPLRRIHLNNL